MKILNNNPENFDMLFDQAYRYAKSIATSICGYDHKDDLLQDFALQVLSNKDKFTPILHYKRTVYLILKGINSNRARRLTEQHLPSDNMAYFNPIVPNSIIDLELINSEVAKITEVKPSIADLKEQNIRKDLKNGLTHREIAKKYKISTFTIYNKFVKNNDREPVKKVIPKTLQYWKMYFQGFNHHDIAEHFNVTAHSVSQNLYKINKALRSRFPEYCQAA